MSGAMPQGVCTEDSLSSKSDDQHTSLTPWQYSTPEVCSVRCNEPVNKKRCTIWVVTFVVCASSVSTSLFPVLNFGVIFGIRPCQTAPDHAHSANANSPRITETEGCFNPSSYCLQWRDATQAMCRLMAQGQRS